MRSTAQSLRNHKAAVTALGGQKMAIFEIVFISIMYIVLILIGVGICLAIALGIVWGIKLFIKGWRDYYGK